MARSVFAATNGVSNEGGRASERRQMTAHRLRVSSGGDNATSVLGDLQPQSRRAYLTWGLLVVIGATIFRLVVAARLPLTEDEAYYWTWSQHLAFGYLDHPPAVAWLIAAGSIFGQSPLAIRLPFILCGAMTALALARATVMLSGDLRAGAVAAIIFTLIPQPRMAIGEALPDGPYLLCWALALWLTLRAMQQPTRSAMLWLGIAMGGAMLSRWFGWFLLIGIVLYACAPQRRAIWKNGFWIAPVTAVLMCIPLLVWNATHGWMNIAFTFSGRDAAHAFSARSMMYYSTLRTLIFAIIFWIAARHIILRPRYSLLAWTALPLAVLVIVLSPFDTVESYWLLGPLTSLCVGLAIWYTHASTVGKRAVAVTVILPACYTAIAVGFSAIPEAAQSALLEASNGALKQPFYSSAYAYEAFAHDVDTLANAHSALVLTNRYEIASELYYHGVDSLVVGFAPQTAQWNQWHKRYRSFPSAVIVTFDPLSRTPDLAVRIERACGKLQAGPTLRYTYAGTSAATFYTTWCEKARANQRHLVIDP